MSLYKILSIFLLLGFSQCNSYRILAIFPFHGRSHMIVLESVAKALAARGHQVDVISHFPQKKSFPNYTDIVELSEIDDANIQYKNIITFERRVAWFSNHAVNKCTYLNLPMIKKFIEAERNKATYDLALIHFYSGFQCFSAIGHMLNLPIVGVVTTLLYPWMHTFIGNPLNLATYPSNLHSYENDKLSFWERLHNVWKTGNDMNAYYGIAERQEYYLKTYLGPEIPYYRVLEKNVALILANTYYAYHGVKSKTPTLVEIGGIHINSSFSSIDKSLKTFLNDSKDGFIFFSFGSLMIIETLPPEILEKFIAIFRKISPIRVVLRTTKGQPRLKNLPDNVCTRTWLPQQQILQHPNIKAFITHGGGLGIQEAVYYSVPMVCLPLFAEQMLNCDVARKKNISLRLNYKTAEIKDIEYAFKEIIFNPAYREAIGNLSELYRDRPLTPSEEVIFWVEYVIRHGRNVLRSPAVDLKWWQNELLDVYAFIAICYILFTCLTIYIACLVFKFLSYVIEYYRVYIQDFSKKTQ